MNNNKIYLKVLVLKYDEHMQEIFDIACYLSPTSKQGEELDSSNWTACEK